MNSPLPARLFIALGALAAAFAVGLGAAAVHVPAVMAAAATPGFVSALQLHQFHALGLMITGLAALHWTNSRWLLLAGVLMLYGLLAFSGNLYLRTLAGIDTFRALVPSGGGAWMLGWLALAVGVARGRVERIVP
ncbi:MAG: DUF423 domain-containing protein [Rhodocyclaceae bacterium]|nr:DUF423 domain-containing protein [Rhodocyclaceae bacterium]